MTTPTIDPILDQLRSTATLQEYRFRSQVPLIGPFISRFRELWNDVSTTWYVRPLIQQQSEINQQLVSALAAQERVLRDFVLRLAENENRLTRCEEGLTDCDARLKHHDGWLIEQDREQSATICDLSDTALRLVQANKRLVELEHRLAMLENGLASPVAEQ